MKGLASGPFPVHTGCMGSAEVGSESLEGRLGPNDGGVWMPRLAVYMESSLNEEGGVNEKF